MIITFEKLYLQELYNKGKTSDKKHRFQPAIIRKYIRIIDLMISIENTSALLRYNSLNYKKLSSNKSGICSVRVNDQYRIELEEETEGENTFVTICNITELSNHYK